jgi:pathogenesis-related protein 1
MLWGAKAWVLPILVWCTVAPAFPADRNWQVAMLAAHNRVRATLDLPPLRWSDKLAGVAYEWAVILLRTSAFDHRRPNRYGENLFEIRGGSVEAKDVVAAWADEARDYNYHSNTCRGVCGHYTQIVWRETTHVGCAVARDAFREVWVCNYDPPGNVVGRRPY